jgi:2-hydroxy-3-oxopropionate reductase
MVASMKIDLEQINSQFMELQIRGEGGVDRIRNVADREIKTELENIDGIAGVQVYGGRENSIEVRLDEKACKAKGVKMIDAPVSGGEPKAIDGTLSIMVGGDEKLFLSVKDILLKMGASAVYCGPIGAGNTTKLANQVIVAVNIAACAEAFTLAKKAGVDPVRVFDAIKGGLAGSTVMNAKLPMMLAGNFKPGFKIDLHIKDLSNALDTGHGVGAPLPLTAALMEMMQTLKADGCGQNDHSGVAKYYAKLSGTPIGS